MALHDRRGRGAERGGKIELARHERRDRGRRRHGDQLDIDGLPRKKALVLAEIKRHQREALGRDMNSYFGRLRCGEARGGNEKNQRDAADEYCSECRGGSRTATTTQRSCTRTKHGALFSGPPDGAREKSAISGRYRNGMLLQT